MGAECPDDIVIAAAVILDGTGRMLVVRKQGFDRFMQPGGKIDAGETAEQALLRELREEIAVDFENGDFSYAGAFRAPAANEPDAMVTAHTFVTSRDIDARAAGEIAEARWLELDDEDGLKLADLTKNHILPLARRTVATRNTKAS